jgi:hypothetical protein
MKYKDLGTMLSKDEMKKVKAGYAPEEGGGSCCWHSGDWMAYNCGLSQGAAQSGAAYYAANNGAGNHGYWCCASCS